MKTPIRFALLLALTFTLALMSLQAGAAGNVAAGKEKSVTCESCHGKDGRGIDPNYPVLAGQHESYLIKALSDYRSGRRADPVMGSFTRNLTNQDIEDLAAWYASLEGLYDLSIQ